MSTITRRVTTAAAPNGSNWRSFAACRNVDPEIFFPIGTSEPELAKEEEAKRVCWGCPVVKRCGQWALDTRQDTGVWGGMSEHDRRLLHRRDGRRTYRPGQMSASEHVLTYQLVEFLALQARGLKPLEIARAMRTNVQTVYKVQRKLAERAEQAVKAA